MDKLENIDHKRLEKALGQIHGLTATIMALVSFHPKPESLSTLLDSTYLQVQARTLPTAVSDGFLIGVDDVIRRVQHALAHAARRAAQQK